MPFEVVSVDQWNPALQRYERRYALQYLKGKKKGEITRPRFKSTLTAITTGKRWMEFRHEIPQVVKRDGRILLLPAPY